MLEQKFIKENLERTFCYKCGANLGGATLVSITEAPYAMVAHAVCPACKAESMVTITTTGVGAFPFISDLGSKEFKKFINAKSIDRKELFDLYKALKKESVWKLLQKKEQHSGKN